MAAIVISSASGAQVNPTNTYLPFNRSGQFKDSPLSSPTGDQLYMFDVNGINIQGISIDNRLASQQYQFGDINTDNLGTTLILDPLVGTIGFAGTGIVSATAGANSVNHLVIYLNGAQYKIQLKNP